MVGDKHPPWYRFLCNESNQILFPDDHTSLVSDGCRAFFMGNALVCGVVSIIFDSLLIHQVK